MVRGVPVRERVVNRRIAKKIYRAVRRWPQRYSRHQVCRAYLALVQSPMLVTSKDARWTPGNMGTAASMFKGRCVLISPKCMVLEQRTGLYDWRRRDERIYFERRA